MRALVWIVEETWQHTVAEAAAYLPVAAEVTLLHVTSTEPETAVKDARRGLLGRPHAAPVAAADALRVISQQAAEDLLRDAQARLGREATLERRRGQIAREVVAATEGMDVLVLARDGDHTRLGPRTLGPDARFVVDHAACRLLLIWPDTPPALTTIPPPPRRPPHAAPRR